MTQLYVYIYLFFFRFFSHKAYYRVLSRIPCAIELVFADYLYIYNSVYMLSSVQLLSCVQLFVTPWIAARQASLSITNTWSLLKLMSIESVMPSNHLIPSRPLLLLPSIFPSIRVFSNESALRIRGPKYWSFSLNVSPSNEKWAHTSFHFSISLYGKFLSLI